MLFLFKFNSLEVRRKKNRSIRVSALYVFTFYFVFFLGMEPSVPWLYIHRISIHGSIHSLEHYCMALGTYLLQGIIRSHRN